MKIDLTPEEIKEYNNQIVSYNREHRFDNETKDGIHINDTNYVMLDCINLLTDEAKRHERMVSSDLKDLLPEGCHFEGFDNRLKTRERIQEKLMEDSIKKYNNDFIAATYHLYDSLRYTIIMPFENHFDYVDAFLNDLLDMDYQIYRVKNRWTDDFCKGVQVIAIDPSGYKFEIQIHTQENYDIKEIYSREPYNLSRDPNAPALLKEKANALRSYYHRLAHLPVGAETYEFKRKESHI